MQGSSLGPLLWNLYQNDLTYLVGLVSHNALINTQNMKPTSPNKQSVLVPVRLGNNSSVIRFDYKDKQNTLGYSPK